MPRTPVTARHDCCLPVALRGAGCVLLSNGKVLISGGTEGAIARRECYLYDPVTNTVAVTGNLPVLPFASGKKYHKVVRMTLNGVETVLAVGPGDASSTTSQAVYNVVTGVWTTTTSNIAFADHCAAVLLPTGGVLVSCGEGASKACEIFSSAGVWTTVASMNAARRDNGLFVLPSGKVLACGNSSTSELYDIGLNSWTYSGSTTNTHTNALCAQLQNGNVVYGPGSAGTSCELYDAAAGTWSLSGSYAATRYWYAMAAVSGNRALVIGGNVTGGAATNTTDMYSAGACTRMSNMSYARGTYPALVALADGTFVVVGGYGSATAASMLERYNPANNSWTDLSSIGRVAA